MIEIAKSLESQVEMGDDDFRNLLKSIFKDMPSYHIDALVRIAKKDQRGEGSIDRLSKLVGGLM